MTPSLDAITGVGPKSIAVLSRMGITQLSDALFVFPNKFIDKTRLTPLSKMTHGEACYIEAKVISCQVKFQPRRNLICLVSDGAQQISLRFFHFNQSQKAAFENAEVIRAYGEPRHFNGQWVMVHPEYRLHKQAQLPALDEQATPVYPNIKGLGPVMLQRVVDYALAHVTELDDPISPALRAKHQLMPRLQAIKCLHHGSDEGQQKPAMHRLVFEELLAHQLQFILSRQQRRTQSAKALVFERQPIDDFVTALPFTLTADQQTTIDDCLQDMQRGWPMQRLIQGDVGCGKSVVAATVSLAVINAGAQVAIMAPTDILAVQLASNMQQWFKPLGIEVGLLTGKLKAAQKKQVTAAIASHQVHCVVGTHALFQDSVEYADLGLVIVDEQHRFGVEQRAKLLQKGQDKDALNSQRPHQLHMSATPIPRSLAKSQMSEFDMSLINTMPKGRLPVDTVLLSNNKRGHLIERMQGMIAQGQQVYWVCTLVEESEHLQAENAEATWESLQQALPHQHIGLIHGRMKAQEKDHVMTDFKAGRYHILVATTVIEVGVDVADANLIVIENPERLGLSQLHQLRGRVGRGDHQAYCVLLYAENISQHSRERLNALKKHHDGFAIAQVDMEQRGVGELYGKQQTGSIGFRLADLSRDHGMIDEVAEVAQQIYQHQPTQVQPLIDMWLRDAETVSNS